MIEKKYSYTYEYAIRIADHYLGLTKQLDKMKKGRMMKVKSLSEVSRRWLFISVAMIAIAVIALTEFVNKGENYMLAFAAVIFVYGVSCIFTAVKDKKTLENYKPVLSACVQIDSKGIRELQNKEIITEFSWKDFEFCITTETIITFFGKTGKTIYLGFEKEFLEQFEKFLEENKMDADYVIKC